MVESTRTLLFYILTRKCGGPSEPFNFWNMFGKYQFWLFLVGLSYAIEGKELFWILNLKFKYQEITGKTFRTLKNWLDQMSKYWINFLMIEVITKWFLLEN